MRLLDELGEAIQGAYRLSIDAGQAVLSEVARVRRARLEGWIADQVRALPAKSRPGAAERLRDDVVKDAAATLLQRLVYLRLLETAKLRTVTVVTGGWESRGYKDFREAAREGQYHVVVGNPPYQSTSKLADKAYAEHICPLGKPDLYAAFLLRGLQLACSGGMSALVTMRNWMFIKQLADLRQWRSMRAIFACSEILALGPSRRFRRLRLW